MASHNDLGDTGEDLAQGYLVQKGYNILERNWRYSKGEIDLIAMDQEVLVFIEVKTRSGIGFGRPEEFVTDLKTDIISKTAAAYMSKIGHEWSIRFDVIGIVIPRYGNPQITHFEDAFFSGI